MQTKYLVCYDIADNARLARVYRFMKDHGAHLQLSVFLCSLTWPELGELKSALSELIDDAQDDVRIYPLPSGESFVTLGRGDRVPEGVWLQLP
jgi:CRISPR-associated protein Cas2